MAFQPIKKKYLKTDTRDCKDFKPNFFNRRCCKLEDKCTTNGYYRFWQQGCWCCTGIDIDRWKK